MMMAWLTLLFALWLTEPPKVTRIVIPERVVGETWVCAEWTAPSAPRQPNRGCALASTVRGWILANANEDCE